MARAAISASRLLLNASAETSTVMMSLPEMDVASLSGFCHGVKKSGSSGFSDIMARNARVTGLSCSGTSRNSRYRKMLPPLRPIQYTGALLEDWVVSSGALVEGASGMVPPDAGTEARVPVGDGPPSAVQPASMGTSTRTPARTAGRKGPFIRPALLGTEVSGTVLPLSFRGVACRSPGGLESQQLLDFQHYTAVRPSSGSVAVTPQLQRERYEADMKLIPNGRARGICSGPR